MEKAIAKEEFTEITKELLEKFIQLYNPCMDDYLYVVDLQQDYYCISKHAAERFHLPGYSFFHLTERLGEFVDANDLPRLEKEMEEVRIGKMEFHNLCYRWLDKNKEPVWINCRGRRLDDKNGRPQFLIGCINEIGERQKADNVSGLLGEMTLGTYVEQYMDTLPAGFLMRIGIDNLGAINGNFGTQYGDFIIRKTAECLNAALEEGQQVFRVVADEYMIVDFCGRSIEDALHLYRKIRKEVDDFIRNNKYQAVYTMSAGIIDTKIISGGYDRALKLSEFTINEAKNRGRNGYYIFEASDYENFKKKRGINSQLHNAVNHDFSGFEPYFQPIVDAKTHQIVGAEALMRFFMISADGEKEMVSPIEFIPLLEQTGLIIPAGKWMMLQAIATCKKWQAMIPDFKMNINLSYVQVIKSDVLEDILDTIELCAAKPSCIGIELTESGYLDSNPHFQKLWNGLKNYGVQVILDDFGTGYSNLHSLGDLKPNYIKIDRSFTLKALQNEYEYQLLGRIIDMAHSLKLAICIEGVENTEELQMLENLGADYIQGYLFGKPYPKEEFERRFLNR